MKSQHADCRRNLSRSRLMASSGLFALVLGSHLGLSGEAFAQATAQAGADVEEVVITASRVQREGFTAPSPTTVVGTQELELRAPTNIIGILNEVPSFRPTQTPTTRTIFAGAGQSSADLRGLGNRRTLVLVDGRRHVPSAATGVVDLNLIPTIMIERSEVVTGGASAAWGSDAVAGVVNFIIADRLEGFKGDVNYGITDRGDGPSYKAGAAVGSAIFGGRGHFTIGGEYVSQNQIRNTRDRWPNGVDFGTVTYPAGPRPAGVPSRLLTENVRPINRSFGGVIIGVNADTNPANGADVLRGIQFGPNGTVLSFPYGQVFGTGSIGGGNVGEAGIHNLLSVDIERYSAIANLEYDFSTNLRGILQLGVAQSAANYWVPTTQHFNTSTAQQDHILIRQDNAFLPEQVRRIMQANNIQQFFLGRTGNDLGVTDGNAINNSQRMVVGLEGKVFGDWSWDASYQIGRNVYDQPYYGVSIEENYRRASNSVRNSSGQIVCRVNLITVTDRFCVPMNVFGDGSPSEEAEAYVEGDMYFKSNYKQQVWAANISGEPFSTWAGPVSVASGLEYRREAVRATSDELSQAEAFDYLNPQPYSGKFDVKEIYAETVIPLARDMAFARSFEFNGAIRRTDYSLSGAVTTWKIGATYEPIEEVRFRATRSKDIRAPNMQELFGVSTATTTINNPFTRISTGPIAGVTGGNPDLLPEKAETFTAGVVYQPRWLPRFRASVDYFKISVDESIASYAPQRIADNCLTEFNGGSPGFFCRLLTGTGTLGPNFLLTSIRNIPFNLVEQTAEGVDIEVAYSTPLMGGDLQLRGFASYTADLTAVDVTATTQYAGTLGSNLNGLGGVPRWMGTFTATYRHGRATGSLQARYLGSVRIAPEFIGPEDDGYDPALSNSINDNRNPAMLYLNLTAQYDVIQGANHRVQIYGLIDNLMDNGPPRTGANVFYDVIGRTYKVGARFNF